MKLIDRLRPFFYTRRAQRKDRGVLAATSAANQAALYLGPSAPWSVLKLQGSASPTVEEVASAWLDASEVLRRQRAAHFRAQAKRIGGEL